MKKYKVLLKAKDGYRVYASCRTKAEAELIMDNLNLRGLNKVYKRYQGIRKPSHEVIAGVYSKTAIQYYE